VSRAHEIATRALQRLASRLGLMVVPDPVYSPLVSIPDADDPVGNREWEVTLALAALAVEHRDRLVALLSSLDESPPGLPGLRPLPAAFWIHRRA
jgi:hypothetical protein